MVKQIFHINGMHCPNCAMRIESLEDSLPGITRIDVSYRQESMLVEYREQEIHVDEILAAVHKLGYTIVLPN